MEKYNKKYNNDDVSAAEYNLLTFSQDIQDLIEENRRLKSENIMLQRDVEEYRKLLDNSFKNSQTQAANWLNAIIEGDIEIKSR